MMRLKKRGAQSVREQGSKRSKVFIVHFDNRKSQECQYEWIYIHLRNETEN